MDTSVLVEALGAGGRLREAFRSTIARGQRMAIPSLVLYEWLRGPRLKGELHAREVLFPDEAILPWGPPETRAAAGLYRTVRSPRGREMDLAIAAERRAAGFLLSASAGGAADDLVPSSPGCADYPR